MTCGRYGSYVRGCRCDECTRAARDYHAAWMLRQERPPPGSARHGRYSTYVNYRCRCLECRMAAVDYRRKRREVASG